jgi:hypothetical protein
VASVTGIPRGHDEFRHVPAPPEESAGLGWVDNCGDPGRDGGRAPLPPLARPARGAWAIIVGMGRKGSAALRPTVLRRPAAGGARPAAGHWAAGPGASTVRVAAVVLLGVAPLAVVPAAADSTVPAKLCVVAVGVGLAISAGSTRGSARYGRLPPALLALGAAGILLLVADTAVGPNPLPGLLGRYPRYEGLPVLLLYLGALKAGACLSDPPGTADASRRMPVLVVRVLAVAVTVAATVAVVQVVGGTDRPGSMLGSASDLGAFAVLAAGPLAVAALTGTARSWAVVGSLAAVVATVMSGSRGALVGLVTVGVWCLMIGLVRRDARRVVVVAAAIAAAAALALALPASSDRITGADRLARATVTGRVLLYGATLRLVADQPTTGVGMSGFVDTVGRYQSRRWAARIGPDNPPDSPHNLILQAGSAGGVPVLLVLAGCLVLAGRAGIRSVREGRPLAAGMAAGVTGYGVALQAHFTSPVTTPAALILLGWLVAEQPAIPYPRPAGAPVAGRAAVRPKIRNAVRVAVTRSPAGRGTVRAGRRLAASGAFVLAAAAAGAFVLAAAAAGAAAAEVPMTAAVHAVARHDVGGAGREVALARTLRPWDIDVRLRAAHAFASGAEGGLVPAGAGEADAAAAVAALPRSTEARTALATIREQQGRYGEAAHILDAARADDPVNVDLLLRRGVVAAEADDPVNAERLFLAVTRLRPVAAAAWEDLATLYRQQGRAADAAAATVHARQRR